MKRIFKTLDSAMEIITIIFFTVMVLVGGMQVFNRFVLNHSLSWSEELQRYLHIWVVFLAIPIAYRRGVHIGMDTLRIKLPSSIQLFLSFFDDILWLAVGMSIIVFSQKILTITARQVSPGLGITMSRVYLALVVGSTYISIIALRKLFEKAVRLKGAQL